jgi:pimeloyl-ACP methyl ester carboxylesterase
VPVYLMQQKGATATVILLPGGGGGLGAIEDGKPSSKNFLVRSRDYFSLAGLNVAVMGRSSDKSDLDYADRIAPEHMQDIRKLAEHLKKETGVPVWLVGTSRGSVSATAAAISFGNSHLAGIVLTSSVVSNRKTGAVPSQNLAAIRIPVLVVHHENDSCRVCSPHEVTAIIRGLTNAPVKKLIMIRDGANPTGDPCAAMHYHGFIGAEKRTVRLITDWIRKPAS